MAGKTYDPNHYHVYVIELKKDVLKDSKFRKANPHFLEDRGLPPLYVGMTGRTPEIRFEQHKAKYKSNRYVRRWSVGLRRDLFSSLNPMSYEMAVTMEKAQAEKLREAGYPVWQH